MTEREYHTAWLWVLVTDRRVCVWVEGLTHTLRLSQLTLRICLRGTSPPRPIHQLGPNTPCATVDMGLTTWHWQRWVRPVAEWRLRQKERWIGRWSTFNLNYCKLFHLAEKMSTLSGIRAAGQVRVIFQCAQEECVDQNCLHSNCILFNVAKSTDVQYLLVTLYFSSENWLKLVKLASRQELC